VLQKPIDIQRKRAQEPDVIQSWFDKLSAFIAEFGILVEDIWNFDERGIRIGVAKNQYAWTQNGHTTFIPHANNREQIILVEAVSAGGDVITPMIVIAAKTILESWYIDLPDGYYLNVSENGYSTDLTSLQWLKHFDKMTKDHTQGVYRLLLMDGYDSHHTYEFIKYAEDQKSKLYSLLLHTTHFLQPLDVGWFQPLKWYHGQVLDLVARTGASEFNKTEFFTALHTIRSQVFKRRTILGGYQKTGIQPFNAEIVLTKLRAQEEVNLIPSPITPQCTHVSNDEWVTPITILTLK
jgi:hypothetical protein